MSKSQNIRSFLWHKRGNLNCYICNGPVIFGPYVDSLGYTANYKCIKCNNMLNDYSLAEHNGYNLIQVAKEKLKWTKN